MDYPEHDKLMRYRKEADAIGGFLEFLESKGVVLASWNDGDTLRRTGTRWAALIGEYLEIDEDRLEAEKQAMMEKLRERPVAATGTSRAPGARARRR